jgi:hypothetical protein
VVKVLRLQAPPPVAGLRYHLSFHSGGTGIFDRLHIVLPRTPAEVEAIVARLQLVTPEVAAVDAEWHEQFENLVLDEDEPRPLRAAVTAFLEENRSEILPRPGEDARVWFSPDSGVNSWSVVYEQGGDLCFVAFDQG